MASGGKRGAGERVLESRHVIGLFMLMLLFSALFFTLGYVMGHNQYDGQVRASTTQHSGPETVVDDKVDAVRKHSPVPPASTDAVASSSGWDGLDKQKETDDHLKPVSPPAVSSTPRTASQNNNNGKSPVLADSPRTAQFSGGYTLQVTAVRRESDALDLAKRLQKKKFPAFVLSPQGNKYYRVQVGPYADQKSAEAAKKGLESAGFRAIVKHG
jgi:cell division septation protein DedD